MTEASTKEQSEHSISDSLVKFNLNLTKMIAVKSPCIVKNMDKYLLMLGSREERDEVFANKEDKLPFRFRPEDSHSKPAYAEPLKCAALLIKVRMPKSSGNTRCNIQCLGIVQTMYKYKRPFDYQFLSPALHPLPSKYTLDHFNFHSNVIDSKQMKTEVPLFIVPASNPRLDWSYLSFKPTEKESTGRVRTFDLVYGIPFEEPSVPTAPRNQTAKTKAYLLPILEKLFEDRPVWSRMALNCKTGADPGSLRSALSKVAYHFSSGPWKFLWIKFGVDPREYPKYKLYQFVECRITKLKRARSKALQISDYSFASNLTKEEISRDMHPKSRPEYVTNPKSYILTSDTTTDTARLSYQLIDVELERVQEIIRSTDGKETVCTKETGWFSSQVYEQIKTEIRKLFD